MRKGEGNRGEMIRMRATDAIGGSARTEICSCTESVLYVPIAGNVHVACAMNACCAISVVLWCCMFIDVATVVC